MPPVVVEIVEGSIEENAAIHAATYVVVMRYYC